MKVYGDLLKGYGLAISDSYFNPSEIINGTPMDMAKILTKHEIDVNEKADDGKKPLDIDIITGEDLFVKRFSSIFELFYTIRHLFLPTHGRSL